jgi:hypothetical protein
MIRRSLLKSKGVGLIPAAVIIIILLSDIGMDSDVISGPFQERNDNFQSDIFFSDISEKQMSMSDVGYRQH